MADAYTHSTHNTECMHTMHTEPPRSNCTGVDPSTGRGVMVGGRLTVASHVIPFSLVDVSPDTGLAIARYALPHVVMAQRHTTHLTHNRGLNRVGLRRNRCSNDDVRTSSAAYLMRCV